ncbi:unnamed protein product [Ectocarpus sp. 12 AP-2014]
MFYSRTAVRPVLLSRTAAVHAEKQEQRPVPGAAPSSVLPPCLSKPLRATKSACTTLWSSLSAVSHLLVAEKPQHTHRTPAQQNQPHTTAPRAFCPTTKRRGAGLGRVWTSRKKSYRFQCGESAERASIVDVFFHAKYCCGSATIGHPSTTADKRKRPGAKMAPGPNAKYFPTEPARGCPVAG